MPDSKLPEVWLRGPLPGILPLLQPVAHALLQAREEVVAELADFPDYLLWQRPAEVASVGFHLQHLAGVLDRLTTYARAEVLTAEQLAALAQEGHPVAASTTGAALLATFVLQVDQTLHQIEATAESDLVQPRGVGRSQLPSTVLGLLFHAAEHTQRHVGQLLVTVRVLRNAKAQTYSVH